MNADFTVNLDGSARFYRMFLPRRGYAASYEGHCDEQSVKAVLVL